MNERYPAIAGTLLLTAALFISLGFLGGLIITGAGGAQTSTAPAQQYRLTGLDLINPLLACEGAEETVGDPLLRPFRDELAAMVERLVRSGTISRAAVYFRDLHNGPWHGIHEKEGFSPAGLLKLPVAIALLKQAENDPSLLNRKVKSTGNADLNEGMAFRPAAQATPGREYTVGELMEMMLADSDNNAAELLRRSLPADTLARTYEDLGVPVPAGEEKAFLSVKSFSSFFRILFNASYLSKASSERLLAILSRSSFRSGIAAGVPPDIIVANKYGERSPGPQGPARELHDCGIVYYPDSPFVLCVMTEGPGFEGNAAAIREISRMVFSIVDGSQRAQDQSRDTARPLTRP